MAHGTSVWFICLSFNFTLYIYLGSQSPGEVPVTLITDTGENLGFTFFNYIDYKETMLEQLVKDRMLQAKYFLMLSTKFANEDLTSNGNIAQAQGQRILEENGKTTVLNHFFKNPVPGMFMVCKKVRVYIIW